MFTCEFDLKVPPTVNLWGVLSWNSMCLSLRKQSLVSGATKTGFTVWYGQPAAGWAAAAFFCKPSRLQQVITVNNTFNLAMPCCGKSLAPCRHGLSGHGCSELSSSQVSARIMKNTNRVPLYVVSHSAFSLIPLILTSPFFTSFLSLLRKMPIFSFSLCLSLAPTLYPLLRLSPAL